MSKRKSNNAKKYVGKNWNLSNDNKNVLNDLKVSNRKLKKINLKRNIQFDRVLTKIEKVNKSISEEEIIEARKIFLSITNLKTRKKTRSNVKGYIKKCISNNEEVSILSYIEGIKQGSG